MSVTGREIMTGQTHVGSGGLTVNRRIIVAVVVIGGVTIVGKLVNRQPITKVVIGSYALLVILSLLDVFGGTLSAIAGGLALLAMVTVLLSSAGPLFAALGQLTGIIKGGNDAAPTATAVDGTPGTTRGVH